MPDISHTDEEKEEEEEEEKEQKDIYESNVRPRQTSKQNRAETKSSNKAKQGI